MGIVISVFAGLGKTTVGMKYSNICDLQSSPYRCDYSKIDQKDYEKSKGDLNRTPNKEWPNNYLKAILENLNKYDIVLVPSNLDVRELLVKNNIDFIFVLPEKSDSNRAKLLERYKKRGNNDTMIKNVMGYFDNWSRDQKDYNYKIEILKEDKYLEQLLLSMNLIKENK